jgi:hypothetical protein
VLSDYKCSTSQHPLDDVTRGEADQMHLRGHPQFARVERQSADYHVG